MTLPTSDELVAKLGPFVDSDASDEFVEDAGTQALALVAAFVGTREAEIPDEIAMRACLEVGADLFYRRRARNGIVSPGSAEVTPIRLNRDPMTAAYPLLTPFTGPGIA